MEAQSKLSDEIDLQLTLPVKEWLFSAPTLGIILEFWGKGNAFRILMCV